VSKTTTLKVEPRTGVGKGASRAVRRDGRVPAVIYGAKKDPVGVTIEERELVKILNKGGFLNHTLELEGLGVAEHVLPRDVQFHPVTDRPMHVDFLRLAANAKITVNIPVHFKNEALSPGLKRGAVLNIVRHEIELECPADAIPDDLVVDLTGLNIGDSVHISAIKLPEGARPTIRDRDFTVATIVAPSGLKSDDAAAEAAPAEPAKK
jgi:large subunit ribosomal protein L25